MRLLRLQLVFCLRLSIIFQVKACFITIEVCNLAKVFLFFSSGRFDITSYSYNTTFSTLSPILVDLLLLFYVNFLDYDLFVFNFLFGLSGLILALTLGSFIRFLLGFLSLILRDNTHLQRFFFLATTLI